jgi:hypothetical protein
MVRKGNWILKPVTVYYAQCRRCSTVLTADWAWSPDEAIELARENLWWDGLCPYCQSHPSSAREASHGQEPVSVVRD